MDKEKEAKGILEKVFAMLSGIEKKEAVVSEEIKEDVVAEVEMSEQENSEETIEAKEEVKEVVEEPVEAELSKEKATESESVYVTKEDFDTFKAELKGILDDEIKKKEEASIKLQEKVVELSAQPAAEPVVHSPEMSSDSKVSFHVSDNRPHSKLDNIMDKLNNFK